MNPNKGRGWHGDPEKHAEVGRKGGKAPHTKRGIQASDMETRKRVARSGGKASR